jgi:hypothetical protein
VTSVIVDLNCTDEELRHALCSGDFVHPRSTTTERTSGWCTGPALTSGRGDHVDTHCTGTTMRNYLSVADLERLPAEVSEPYDEGVPPELLEHANFTS